MFYVTIIVNGILLVSVEPVALDRCEALKALSPTTLCIEREPDCGLAAGLQPCQGIEPDRPRKRSVRSRRR
jgi:hypothetical protein